MHIESKPHIVSRSAMPARKLSDDQFDLVEKTGTHCCVARPRFLGVMIQEVSDLEMLADRQIDVALGDLEKTFRRILIPLEVFGQIRTDAIPLEHRAFFLLERHEHRDGETFDDPLFRATYKRQAIKSCLRRNLDVNTCKWLGGLDDRAVSEPDPAVLE